MGGAGFEPAKAEPSDLQSDPFDRSGNPPSHVCQPAAAESQSVRLDLLHILPSKEPLPSRNRYAQRPADSSLPNSLERCYPR